VLLFNRQQEDSFKQYSGVVFTQSKLRSFTYVIIFAWIFFFKRVFKALQTQSSRFRTVLYQCLSPYGKTTVVMFIWTDRRWRSQKFWLGRA